MAPDYSDSREIIRARQAAEHASQLRIAKQLTLVVIVIVLAVTGAVLYHRHQQAVAHDRQVCELTQTMEGQSLVNAHILCS